MSTIEEIIAQAVRLALSGGVPLTVVLALIFASAVLLVLVKRLPPPRPEAPDPVTEWNQDPEQGAVVVPGPPGGTEDDVQSG